MNASVEAVVPVLVTVNTKFVVPAFPSVIVTSLMVTAGAASSLLIVPSPLESEIVASTGAVRFTKKVSFASCWTSPHTMTLIVFDVSPGRKVRSPDPDW